MPSDLTFKQVCEFIKKDDPKLIDAADKLLGLALMCSPVLVSPITAVFLPQAITVKNEIVKIGKSIFDTLTTKNDDDYIARQQRMEIAYGLICFTAFFEALDRQIPEILRKRIGLHKGEKIFLAKSVRGKNPYPSEGFSSDPIMRVGANQIVDLVMPFPHPVETLAQQIERNAELWNKMARGFLEFIQNLAFWEEAKEVERMQILTGIEMIPKVAPECFDAQYFELARRYEDFSVWADLQEHKKTKALVGSLSEQQVALAKESRNAIDVGFSRMHDAVLGIPG